VRLAEPEAGVSVDAAAGLPSERPAFAQWIDMVVGARHGGASALPLLRVDSTGQKELAAG